MFFPKLYKTLIVLTNFSKFFYLIPAKYKKMQVRSFLNRKIKNNTILITEPSNSHGEVIPSIIKYCQDLGFNCEVLITDEMKNQKPLKMFKNLKVFTFNLFQYAEIIKSEKLNKYRNIIFTSSRVYYDSPRIHERFVFDYFKGNKIDKNKIILLEHHLDLLDEKKEYKFIGLPEYSARFGAKMVNTSYFGCYKQHNKNKTTSFIIVGAVETERKNHNLLLNACRSLLDNGIDNFEVVVIGRGKLEINNPELKQKIHFLGRLKYNKMYKRLNKSDFFLPLLDPENPEHDRYITVGTSGSYQLVYGFQKPCLIHEKFAAPHFLNNENSIIYSKNEDLYKAMKQAIDMNNSEYQKMQENLKVLSNNLYNKSLENLRNTIEESINV